MYIRTMCPKKKLSIFRSSLPPPLHKMYNIYKQNFPYDPCKVLKSKSAGLAAF